MIAFEREPDEVIKGVGKEIHVFLSEEKNLDKKTVKSFGEEWAKFNYFSDEEIKKAGDQYFDIVSGKYLQNKNILDVGCGMGRWSKYLSDKACFIDCIDPSNAVYSAAKNLKQYFNIRISKVGVENIPFPDNSFDFVFSLGVLHHIPNTEKAMMSCVRKVNIGGYFLVYLYYSLDNRGIPFKTLYKVSDILRRFISKLPFVIKKRICDVIAGLIYIPFIYTSKFFRRIGLKKIAKKIPLSYYADHSFNIVRNDALDRFGTPLEKRFSKAEIKAMMEQCGLSNIIFSENEPYWHALGQKV